MMLSSPAGRPPSAMVSSIWSVMPARRWSAGMSIWTGRVRLLRIDWSGPVTATKYCRSRLLAPPCRRAALADDHDIERGAHRTGGPIAFGLDVGQDAVKRDIGRLRRRTGSEHRGLRQRAQHGCGRACGRRRAFRTRRERIDRGDRAATGQRRYRDGRRGQSNEAPPASRCGRLGSARTARCRRSEGVVRAVAERLAGGRLATAEP